MSETAEINTEGAAEIATDDSHVDFVAEAAKMGWSPLEEFKGDPKHWTDAETFYNRAVQFMPIAKATIKKLSNKIDAMEREQKKASEFFSKAEQRGYEKAMFDIKVRQEAAVESGDVEAFRAADAEAVATGGRYPLPIPACHT